MTVVVSGREETSGRGVLLPLHGAKPALLSRRQTRMRHVQSDRNRRRIAEVSESSRSERHCVTQSVACPWCVPEWKQHGDYCCEDAHRRISWTSLERRHHRLDGREPERTRAC